LTETVSDEKVVVSTGTVLSSEKIAERNTIVYETRIEPTVIEAIGEKIKAQLFTRFGFMKPKPEEIQLVSIDKYYEPYMVVGGRYAIDYYRKCAYTVKVDNRVQEVILSNRKYRPNQATDSPAKDHNVVKLEGEERLTNEVKASLILDKFGQQVAPKELPSAPSEKNPREILAAFGVNELFEVNERAVVYAPRFRVLYTNVKTGEGKAVEFDGVTAQRIQRPRPHPQFLQKST
jgi:hypothetical protein